MKYTPAWMNLAISFLALGNFKRALRCINRAVKIKPVFLDAVLNKGSILMSLNRHEEAIRCFNRVLIEEPSMEIAWINKIGALVHLEREEAVVKCLKELQKINPFLNVERFFDQNYEETLSGRQGLNRKAVEIRVS